MAAGGAAPALLVVKVYIVNELPDCGSGTSKSSPGVLRSMSSLLKQCRSRASQYQGNALDIQQRHVALPPLDLPHV